MNTEEQELKNNEEMIDPIKEQISVAIKDIDNKIQELNDLYETFLEQESDFSENEMQWIEDQGIEWLKKYSSYSAIQTYIRNLENQNNIIQEDNKKLQTNITDLQNKLQQIVLQFAAIKKDNADQLENQKELNNNALNAKLKVFLKIMTLLIDFKETIMDDDIKMALEIIIERIINSLKEEGVMEIVVNIGDFIDINKHKIIRRVKDNNNINKVIKVVKKGFYRDNNILLETQVEIGEADPKNNEI